jgi:hypothetical protein
VGQGTYIGVVELNRKRATFRSDCEWLIEPTMLDSKIIECAQGCTGKVAKFWVISLCLKLSDNCDRNNDFMLIKFEQGSRIS